MSRSRGNWFRCLCWVVSYLLFFDILATSALRYVTGWPRLSTEVQVSAAENPGHVPVTRAGLAEPAAAAGETLHVSAPDATCGVNAPCFRTIQAAIDAAGPADRVLIHPGRYPEQLRVFGKNRQTGASESDRIVIEADPSAPWGSVVIGPLPGGRCPRGPSVDIKGSSFLTLRGLVLRNAGGRGVVLRGQGPANEAIHIERNRIYADGDSRCSRGISIWHGNENTLVANNLIDGTDREGIYVTDDRGGTHSIVSNTLYGNRLGGILLARRHRAVLANNLIIANGENRSGRRVGIQRRARTPGPEGIVLLGNLVCGNKQGEIKGVLLDEGDEGNLTPTGREGPGVEESPGCDDPERVFTGVLGEEHAVANEAADFRLAEGSPAIDAGVALVDALRDVQAARLRADLTRELVRPLDGDDDGDADYDIGAIENGETGEPTSTPSPAPSTTPSPTTTSMPTPTTSTASPSPTDQPTPSPSPTPPPSPSPPTSPSPTASPSPSPTAAPTASPSPTPSPSPIPTPNTAPLAEDDTYVVREGDVPSVPAAGVLDNDSDLNGDTLNSRLIDPPANGSVDLRPDGSFEYMLDGAVELGTIDPVVEFFWPDPALGHATGANAITVVPSIIDLDGEDGLPEIVFPTGLDNQSLVRVIRPATGEEVFTFFLGLQDPDGTGMPFFENPAKQRQAAGDVDGDGRPELIFTVFQDTEGDGGPVGDQILVAFEHDGQFKWRSEIIPVAPGSGEIAGATIADLDADGTPEIVVGVENGSLNAFDHEGRLEWTADADQGTHSVPAVVADLDLDGRLEILWAGEVFAHDGTSLWRARDAAGTEISGQGWPGVANLDDDPFGEAIFTANGRVYSYEHDGALRWTSSQFPAFSGALFVADLDDDGLPEIGVGSAQQFTVLKADGTVKWTLPGNFETGGTAFDFDGDGAREVVLHRVDALVFARGSDGMILREVAFRRTSFVTNPQVADADGDGAAEVILHQGNGPTGFGEGVLAVFGNDPSKAPWPRTRAIWNQEDYWVTNVEADGGIPRSSRPNWLVPGLNHYLVNTRLPEEQDERFDSFTYVADDGSLDSNVATVHLEVLPPGNPPRILSQPDLSATVGFPYRYPVLAVDPDVGDVLSFALSSAPAGMAIDPASGEITWTPGENQVGDHPIGVTVSDTMGFNSFQPYMLTVGLPVVVPDVVGESQAGAEAAIVGAALTVGHITLASDPVVPAGTVLSQNPAGGAVAEFGAAVDLVVSAGPAPEDVDDDGDDFSESEGDCDDTNDGVFPGSPDSEGNGIDENCDGGDGTLVLDRIVVSPAGPVLLAGTSQTFMATGVYTNGTSRDLHNLATWESTNTAVASITSAGVASGLAAGTTTIRATKDGVTGSTMLSVVARVAGDTSPPVAEITSPADGATITAPVEVVGTATDANFLEYELAIARAGETGFTRVHSSTTPVTGGVLGQLDPTLLINDLYTLRLRVYDAGGNVTTAEAVYQVDDNMKVGRFTLSFTDLNVPLSGLPITIGRTYDSHDKGQGDFGVGWRLGIQALRLRTNRPLATGWRMVRSLFFHQLLPTDAHKVSVTLPDGQVEEFDFVLSRTQAVGPGFDAFAGFQPRPGTLGTLELDEERLVNVIGTGVSGEEIEIQNHDLSAPFDPQRFRYTRLDGTEVVIVEGSGVESVEDTNGNTLTFGPGGIAHSSGKAVVFARDTEGRITSMTDPNGNVIRYAYDANGDLVLLSDPLGQTTRFTYGPNHYLRDLIDAEGLTFTRSEYDSDGRLVAIVDAQGRRTEFAHDLGDRREVLTDRRGFVTVREYDERGNVVSITDALGHTTTATFDDRSNKLTETDPLGHTTTFTYNGDDLLLRETDPLGHTTSYTYDARGKELTVTDRNGQVTTHTYDGRGNRLTTIDPLGQVTRRAYDARGNRVASTDPLGHTTNFIYDGAGNLLRITDPLGGVIAYGYDESGNRLSETATRTTAVGPQAVTTTYVYDGLNRLVRTIDHLGGTEQREYDAVGNRVAVIDAGGKRTTFSYDGLRNLVSTGFSDGTSEAYTYDAERNRVSETDRGGRTTGFTYDALGRHVKTTYADGAIVQMGYDAAGRPTSETDANGNTTTHGYDAAGRRTITTDALGNMRTWAYDGRGSLLTAIDQNGDATTFEYDANANLIRTVWPDASSATGSYDALGRRLSETDANGNTTTYAYDARGRLTAVTDALGQITRHGYDELGSRIRQTDAAGNVTLFENDALGRLTRTILPLGMTENRAYDAVGNLLTRTDFNGDTIDFSYDDSDRLFRRDYPDGSSVAFTYTGTGQRSSVTDGRGTTAYEYDTRDLLVRRTEPNGTTVEYEYDAAGNRTAITTAAGTTSYTYDALSRVHTVTDPGGGLMTYGYDATGLPTTLTYPSAMRTTRTYDSRGRITAIETRRSDTSLISSYSYALDEVGNRTRVTESSGRVVDYTYDALYRLIAEDITDPVGGNRSFTYAYSPTGNRRSKTELAGTTTYGYDANDRLLSETGPAGAFSYAYDANGNRLSRVNGAASAQYRFDFDNRVSGVQQGGTTLDYRYDADGLRVARDENGAVTDYLWDANREFAQVIEEHDGGADPSARYVWDQRFTPLGSLTSAGIRYLLTDAGHNVRRLIGSTSTVTDTVELEGFGNVLEETGATPNPYRLHGQHQEDESGLYYIRARWYDPETGIFLGRDPSAGDPSQPQSLNKYAFTHNNPINSIDPSGLESIQVTSLAQSIASTVDVRPVRVQKHTEKREEECRDCETCVSVVDRIKQEPNLLLPAVCSETHSNSSQSSEKCHEVLNSIAIYGSSFRYWLFEGCYDYLPGAKKWVRPCPSLVICRVLRGLDNKPFCDAGTAELF